MENENPFEWSSRVRTVDSKEWVRAFILGKERQWSHEGRRKSHEDRGRFNERVDIQGAFGELSLYEALKEAGVQNGIQYMRRHLFMTDTQMEKEADEPDAVVKGKGFDAKTFDWDPKKRYFAINQRKHEKLTDSCDYYYCVLAVPFGRESLEIIVPYEDVSLWTPKELGDYGSPSLNEPLSIFLRSYWGEEVNEERFRQRYSRKDIKRTLVKSSVKEQMIEEFPDPLASRISNRME